MSESGVRAPIDWERLRRCLERLSPYIDLDAVALTGSVAITLQLRALGLPVHRPIGDIDLVARSWTDVAASAANDFLVGHFHLPHGAYRKFLVQLVDPLLRLKIDVFPARLPSLERAALFEIGSVRVRALDVHELLDEKVRMLELASVSSPIDEKHYEDAVVLARVCARAPPSRRADTLCRETYGVDPAQRCPRCDASPGRAMQPSPKRRILEALGHV